MKKNKTKRLFIRVTEDIHTEIKNRAKKFDSISHFVFTAIQSFTDTTIKERMEAKKQLAEFYCKYDKHLAHIGGNLNQAMKRVNEASIAGLPTQALILNNLMPSINECHSLLIEMRKELYETTRNIAIK